jgi:hypothetical protein
MATEDKDTDHPERDASWDERARHETPTERLDRNWGDLLQELRVVQTGVQLLTGFLLTLGSAPGLVDDHREVPASLEGSSSCLPRIRRSSVAM